MNQKKASGTEPAKDPDEADSRPDTTCVEGHDRAAKAKDKEQLECPHVLHNMKYGSEDLLGLKNKVSAVKGTKEGKYKQWKLWRTQELQHQLYQGIKQRK